MGFKIKSLKTEEEDLALFCFSLMQAEAIFPIKIFTIIHKPQNSSVIDDQDSRKDIWMETQLLVSNKTISEG